MSICQISPGRKNSLVYEIDGSDGAWGWDSEQPDQAWLGHRDRPNEVLIRNPALMGAAGQAASALPAGHVEGFFDTFGAHFRAVYADVVAGAPSSAPAIPRSRTATTRCWSATRSREAPAKAAGSMSTGRAAAAPGPSARRRAR